MSGEATLAIKNGLQKAAKELIESAESKASFEKELDNLVEEGKITKKEADDVIAHLEEVAEVDNLAKVAGRGRRLGHRLSKSNLNDLVTFLKKQGCDFEIFPVEGSHEIKNFIGSDGKALIFGEGKQAAFVYTSTKMKFIVREEATVYETLHEFMHFKHAKEIGLAKYHSLGGAGTAGELLKEQRVFNKMIENKDLLTRAELKHSLDYLNDDIYDIRGIDPIKFSFDINKIPEVRKEIDIKNIFNLK